MSIRDVFKQFCCISVPSLKKIICGASATFGASAPRIEMVVSVRLFWILPFEEGADAFVSVPAVGP
jgi:hypothetical protein